MQAAFQSAIPDIYLGDDGILNIIINIEAGQIEGLYLANQLVLQDVFIQTASLQALQLHAEMFGVAQILGTTASGDLLFSGGGGTFIPIGTEVALDPGGGADLLYFITTQESSIPDPGIPTAPTIMDAATSGVLTGTYEYVVSFITDAGETLPSQPSNAITLTSSQMLVANIPVGGPGTIQRKIYRSLNGGVFQLVDTLADNSTTSWQDNVTTPGTGVPQTVSTAEQLLVDAQAEQPGLIYNAVGGAIGILANVPDGITAVTNPSAFTGGSDPETSDAFRARLLGWIQGPQTGAPQDLVNWALTVPGVAQATCFPNYNLSTPTPGYATVLIAGEGGAIPTPDIVDAVQTLLASKTLANITIVVSTFTAVTQDVTVDITPASGFLTANLTPSVQEAISNYINSVPAGGTLYLSGIVAAVLDLPSILDVSVTSPTVNQVSASNIDKFVAGAITVDGSP